MVCLGHRGIPRTKYSALSKYLWDDASQRRTLVWFWLFAQKPYCFLISCDIKSSPPLAGIRGAPELGSQSNSLIFILSVLHHVLFAPTTPGNIPFPRQDLLPLSSLQVFAPSPENAWKAVQGISARPNPTYHLWISSQPSSWRISENIYLSFAGSLLYAILHFLLTKILWGRFVYPQFKDCKAEFRAILRSWSSLNSTGQDFNSLLKSPCPPLSHHPP